MNAFADILNLINKGKINEAEIILRENKDENGEYWYLVGLISFFKGNEDVALDFFLKSIQDENTKDHLKTNAKRIAAYILFSKGEYEKVEKMINNIKEKIVDDYFVLFSTYLFMNKFGEAESNLEKAYALNPSKTKALLIKFYRTYVRPSTNISNEEKELLLRMIEKMQGNA